MTKRRSQLGQNVRGTTYKDETDPRVVEILEAARSGADFAIRSSDVARGERLCIRYGDPETGRDWGDPDMCGTIGRSGGDIKIPLLIPNRRSSGGEGILDAKIIKITRGAKPKQKHGVKYVLYQHPKYHHPAGDIEAFERIAKDIDTEARHAAKSGDKEKAAKLREKARAVRNQRYQLGRVRRKVRR